MEELDTNTVHLKKRIEGLLKDKYLTKEDIEGKALGWIENFSDVFGTDNVDEMHIWLYEFLNKNFKENKMEELDTNTVHLKKQIEELLKNKDLTKEDIEEKALGWIDTFGDVFGTNVDEMHIWLYEFLNKIFPEEKLNPFDCINNGINCIKKLFKLNGIKFDTDAAEESTLYFNYEGKTYFLSIEPTECDEHDSELD